MLSLFVFSFFLPSSGSAIVSGVCSNCHTMHNSQDNNAVASAGEGAGWDDTGKLTNGSLNGPMDTLLISSCLGCHTSSTSSTIITVGSTRIPIVYNTDPPVNPLAGGNFYWVSLGSAYNGYGHNVYGISDPDTLPEAPGRLLGCANSCHDTLADPPNNNNRQRGGCQGCHVYTSHHRDRGWYRFLKGHTPNSPFSNDADEGADFVIGIGHADWEQTTSATEHNYYQGTDLQYDQGSALETYQTITSFCQGCHAAFHGPEELTGPPGDRTVIGMGSASPWIRHPTDILLPDANEYAAYNPVSNYSVEAPVAWLNPASPVRDGAVVMCLSCHRPHGSDQPDLLRWSYSTMIVGNGAGNGCFTCHTTKD